MTNMKKHLHRQHHPHRRAYPFRTYGRNLLAGYGIYTEKSGEGLS